MRGQVFVVCVLLISGCAGEASDPPPRSQQDDVMAFVGDGAPLEPGRHRFEAFEPRMSFQVGPGWLGGHSHAEFYDVQREEGALLGFARPSFVFGPDGPAEVIGLDAREALHEISSIEEFDAGDVVETTVDGRVAFAMRTKSRASIELFGGDDGTFTAEAGRHRLLSVDVDGVLVIIIEHIWAEDRDPIEPMAQAVIDSVRFEAPRESPTSAAFAVSGCPIDDPDACRALSTAARALIGADRRSLV